MGKSSMLLTTLVDEDTTIWSPYVHYMHGYTLSGPRRHVSSYPIDTATDAYLAIGASAKDTGCMGKEGHSDRLG